MCRPHERVIWERRRAGNAKVTGLNTDQSLRAPRKGMGMVRSEWRTRGVSVQNPDYRSLRDTGLNTRQEAPEGKDPVSQEI